MTKENFLTQAEKDVLEKLYNLGWDESLSLDVREDYAMMGQSIIKKAKPYKNEEGEAKYIEETRQAFYDLRREITIQKKEARKHKHH